MDTLSISAIIFICLVSFIIAIFLIAAQWKIYQKADQPGWACIIPIYNMLVLLKIIGKPWWWLLLMLIPFVNIVFAIWMVNLLSKSFGKDTGFTLGLIFLGFIFYPVLGFGSARYRGPYGDPQKFQEYQQTHRFDFEQ
ncbi:MAG TPA: DUF5684 domain-containing protein [Flavisolibacter sp.]|nr:DUF5684 domain-containing protein [Flavisolibacter sp.]